METTKQVVLAAKISQAIPEDTNYKDLANAIAIVISKNYGAFFHHQMMDSIQKKLNESMKDSCALSFFESLSKEAGHE